jgi:hypothetical protein
MIKVKGRGGNKTLIKNIIFGYFWPIVFFLLSFLPSRVGTGRLGLLLTAVVVVVAVVAFGGVVSLSLLFLLLLSVPSLASLASSLVCLSISHQSIISYLLLFFFFFFFSKKIVCVCVCVCVCVAYILFC